jgi:hypothetical protein
MFTGDHLACQSAIIDLYAFDVAVLDLVNEFRVRKRGRASVVGAEIIEHGHQHHSDDRPQDQIFHHVIQSSTSTITGDRAPSLGPGGAVYSPTPSAFDSVNTSSIKPDCQ